MGNRTGYLSKRGQTRLIHKLATDFLKLGFDQGPLALLLGS